MGNLFHELDQLLTQARSNVIADTEVNTQRSLRLVEDMRTFAYGLSWLRQQRAKERMLTLFKHRFQYPLAAEELGVTIQQLYKTLSFAQDKLNTLIRPVLDQLSLGNVEVASIRWDWVKEGRVIDNRLISELTDCIAPISHEGISWKDCAYELRVLKTYSKVSLQNAMRKMDLKRMQFVLSVFCSPDKGYALERKLLEEYVYSDMNADSCIQHLSRYRDDLFATEEEDDEL